MAQLGCRGPARDILHAQGKEEPLIPAVLMAHPGYDLEDASSNVDAASAVRLLTAGLGLEWQLGIPTDGFAHAGQIHLAVFDRGEERQSAGVVEQVADEVWMVRRPCAGFITVGGRVLSAEFRQVHGDRILDGEGAVIDKHHQSSASQRLGHRSDP